MSLRVRQRRQRNQSPRLLRRRRQRLKHRRKPKATAINLTLERIPIQRPKNLSNRKLRLKNVPKTNRAVALAKHTRTLIAARMVETTIADRMGMDRVIAKTTDQTAQNIAKNTELIPVRIEVQEVSDLLVGLSLAASAIIDLKQVVIDDHRTVIVALTVVSTSDIVVAIVELALTVREVAVASMIDAWVHAARDIVSLDTVDSAQVDKDMVRNSVIEALAADLDHIGSALDLSGIVGSVPNRSRDAAMKLTDLQWGITARNFHTHQETPRWVRCRSIMASHQSDCSTRWIRTKMA